MEEVSCNQGVYDCEYSWIPDGQSECASYDGNYQNPEDNIWVVIVGAMVMASMAFGIGANDVANAWGTSVGSGAVPLKFAVLIAGLMNVLGATLLGYGVSDKIEKSVSDLNETHCWSCGYCDSVMGVYGVGMLGALISAAVFLAVATFLKMPVSTTHAIVGGVVGMTSAHVGFDCIDWGYSGLGGIILSWVLSPVLSGLIGSGVYVLTYSTIFNRHEKWDCALRLVPVFYSIVTWVMVYLVCLKSAVIKRLPMLVHVSIASATTVLVFVLVVTVVLPRMQQNRPSVQLMLEGDRGGGSEVDITSSTSMDSSSTGMIPVAVEMTSPSYRADTTQETPVLVRSTHVRKLTRDEWDSLDAVYCFKYLLVFNAALESFAHGANDTANSTGPFSAIVVLYEEGRNSCQDFSTSAWVMFVGGLFVALGIVTCGGRVIETIGSRLTEIDFHKGFCIEFSSCVTVVIATLLGLPVSTTHCQIGSVVFVGLVSAKTASEVNFHLFGKIMFACLVTVPLSALTSAAVTVILTHFVVTT